MWRDRQSAGTGVAANGRKLYSVANRTHEKAVAFAEKYGIDDMICLGE